jgi:regulatory protein
LSHQFTRSGPGRRRRRPGPDQPGSPADPALDQEVDPESAARTILLNKLTGQPRTRAELAATLADREIPDEIATKVLDRFDDVGLIDDAAFASAWVESRHTGRGLARRALAHELRRRGVDDELVQDAVDQLDPDREAETARTLVRRKLPSLRSVDRPVAMRRLLGMLARKGYPGGLSMTVVREELATWPGPDDGMDAFPDPDTESL